MGYFDQLSNSIRLLRGSTDEKGLRNAQLGAIHAAAAHFSVKTDPAILVLPTGSGKSLVLMALSYLLQANRVLILTPSKLLRDQIGEDFEKLTSVKKYGLLSPDATVPKVERVATKLAKKSDWNKLTKMDVVIGTPNCLSPGTEGVSEPPSDLFDLVLIDEAHHSPARTWQKILDSFPNAKKILLTATPFRNDRKEIKGRFVYVYPLSKAYSDKIFGDILFVPVTDAVSGDDGAIAKAAEKIFNEDRKKKLNHYLIARTDSRQRAEELEKIYQKNTKLKLRVIHSGHGYRHIKSTITMLREGKLDGIIAVAMLGEGFDFPNLKIAAIHSPHRSLPVTLQFIGRFARTGDGKLGTAKFIAIPNDIKVESERLYREDASWQEIITNLVETQVEDEVKLKQDLETFEQGNSDGLDIDFSLYVLKPYSHVKIYRVNGDINLTSEVEKIQGKRVVSHKFSEELNTRYFLCREETVPNWSETKLFSQIHHDLHVVFYHSKSKLLFINSSDRSFALFEELAKAVAPDGHQILSLVEINRVIRGIRELDFFSIGMKSFVKGSKNESYRIIAGASTQNAVSVADGFLFHRGHVFCKGVTDSGEITLGYSSASKVWSHAYVRLPELVSWCVGLAEKILDTSPVTTNSNLDHLQVGEIVTDIPGTAIICEWSPTALRKDAKIKIPGKGAIRLLDTDIRILSQSRNQIEFVIESNGEIRKYSFDVTAPTFFKALDQEAKKVKIEISQVESSLEDFLNAELIEFYLSDFSRLRGKELFKSATPQTAFDSKILDRISWSGVDIEAETDKSAKAKLISVQKKIENDLSASKFGIIIHDDRSGEVADYVSIEVNKKLIKIALHHCKGSCKPKVGHRVNDLYEVSGQAVKSLLRFHKLEQLFSRLEERTSSGSTFVKGNIADLRAAAKAAKTLKVEIEIFIVQPGLDGNSPTDEIKMLILSTQEFLRRIRDVNYKVICS